MAGFTSGPEAEAVCPVPLDVLGQLYRTDPAAALHELRHLGEDQRARLALYCYGRAHLRGLALQVAASCASGKLAELAGVMGAALEAQSRDGTGTFGVEAPVPVARPKPKISLGGSKISLGGSSRR